MPARTVGADRLAHAIPEIRFEDVRLQRSAGLARHDHQGFRQVDRVLERLDLLRVGAVQHVKLRPAGTLSERFAEHFGAEARSAHAEQQDVGEPFRLHVTLKRFQLFDVGEAFVHDAQPTEPFGFRAAGPERGVMRPELSHAALAAPLLQGRVHGFVQLLGQAVMQAGDAAAEQGGALLGHRQQQRIGRIGKQFHAVLDEVPGHAGKIEPQAVHLGHYAARLVEVLGQRRPDVAVIAERVHRRRRDGIDRVAADQFLDVEHVAVGLVLHAGAGPEQPLRVGACGFQRFPALGLDQVLVGDVGHLRVRDRHLAADGTERVGLLVAGRHALVDRLVDLRVDAADEEAGDAGDAADVLAARVPVLEPGNVRLGHRPVAVEREQQRHVDVDAFADQRAYGGHAFGRAWNLHHQVRTIDPFVQTPCFGDGVLLAQGKIGRDFQADIAVQSLGALEDRLEHVGDVLDVGNRHRLVDVLRVVLADGCELLELLVVIRAVSHCLFED